MAVTARQAIKQQSRIDPVAFPVKSGETIYQGTFVGIGKDGYLYNLDSTALPEITLFGIVADDTANADGEAATTASGSITSTSYETASGVSGDKTWRRVYIDGIFELTFTSITQAMVGTTMYASDNYTIDDVSDATARVPAGTLIKYISATVGWLDLNKFYQGDGTIVKKGALTIAAGNAGMLSWVNPTGKTILIENFLMDFTTGSSASITIDAGVTTASASSDNLIDGVSASSVRVVSSLVQSGTNGGIKKMTSAQYITATLSGASTTLVGNWAAIYRIWS